MNPSGTKSYPSGTPIVVRAVASLGNQFLSWTSTGSITFDSTSSAITNAHIDGAGEIIANFITVQPTQNYQVSWILGQGGSSMNPSGTLTYAGGSAVPLVQWLLRVISFHFGAALAVFRLILQFQQPRLPTLMEQEP